MVFTLHTKNNIYGEAKNIHDQNRSCAGSSGGDAGLVSAKCVPLSVGTDIGGSIRGPAAFCGVYGYRPTPQRMSGHGAVLPVLNGGNP